jgi:hypothetical protein
VTIISAVDSKSYFQCGRWDNYIVLQFGTAQGIEEAVKNDWYNLTVNL